MMVIVFWRRSSSLIPDKGLLAPDLRVLTFIIIFARPILYSMVALTDEMVEIVKATKIFPLATASKGGDPNVVPVGSVVVVDPETIWIGNQFMKQTLHNLQENPKACLYAWGPEAKGCLKIKGTVILHTSGPKFEKMKEMVKARRADLVCKALLELKVTEVFNCKSGPDAGKKLI